MNAAEADLHSRLACVVEATYWDRPYDERIAAIRGMCDLTTDGMTPQLSAQADSVRAQLATAYDEGWDHRDDCDPNGQVHTQSEAGGGEEINPYRTAEETAP